VISFLRERLQGIVAFSFLGVVALTFAFLGLPTFTQTFSVNEYAKVGNYSISQSEYFRAKTQVEENLRSQFGEGLNFSDPAIIDIVSNLTNNSIIEKYTLINFFDDLNAVIPDTFIETELSKLEAFQVDGRFNQDLFKQYLINFNLTKEDLMEDFESDLKLSLAVSLLDATASSFDKSINQYLDLLTERRSISFVELEADNVTKEFIAEEQETEEYFNNNLEQFSIPEKRSFLLLDLNKSKLNLEVSDTELEEAYNLFLENLPAPEKRVSHIMIIRDNYTTDLEYQEKVATVTKELEVAEFSNLVKRYSDDLGTTDTDGDLGYTNGEVFPAEFESIIANLDVNDVSSAVSYENNTHFLKVTEIKGSGATTLEEKTAELLSELQQIKFEDEVAQISSSLTFSSFSLDEAKEFAELRKLELKDYLDLSIDEFPLNLENSSILSATEVGNWSSPLEVGFDNYSFAYVYDAKEKTYKEFSDVMSSVQEIIIETKKTDYLNEIYANSDITTLDQESLSEMFQINNFKVEKFKAINRSTSLLSNDVVAQVFNDPDVGEIKKEITPNGLLLYVVEDRIKGDYSNVSEEDRLAIIEESKRTNLQLVFNELRAKYNFDEKISVSNQFANQNL
jgi:peptidyl-prolyl cis-trans isomerase D